MSLQSLFLSVTDEWPFQNHLPSRTLPTQRALSHETSTAAVYSLFPSVNTDIPTISRSLQTVLYWLKELCLRTLEQWPYSHSHCHQQMIILLSVNLPMQRTVYPRRPDPCICLVIFPVSLMNGHYKTIFQVELQQLYPKRPQWWLCRVSSLCVTTELPAI